MALSENSGHTLDEPTSAAHHAPLEPSEILRRVRSMRWVHSIDLGHGIVTPGAWGPPRAVIRRAFDAIDFRGKKVLDIGCWDGGWSFEAERRGAAEVFATDYVCQRHSADQQTFQLAHRVLNSRVHYHPDISVYEVDQLGIFDFDVVIFCGVYYHLRHPLLALARLRQVMQDDAMIVVEGAAIYGPRNPYSDFYYRRVHVGDPSNWCVPTIPCLREWMESSFFDDVVEHRARGRFRDSPGRRPMDSRAPAAPAESVARGHDRAGRAAQRRKIPLSRRRLQGV
jgi:tRNA (mo5U34)-methyltransferase